MKNDITYGSIVPLVGGENLGIMEALDNQLPEWILSYSPFKQNDSHLISYLQTEHNWDKEYVLLDECPDYKANYVDVVNAVCPCAGLSSYSKVSHSESKINDWLYTTAEYILENVKPIVFWGENAPRLFTNAGNQVSNKLYSIGKKFGYSLTLYLTKSEFHGLSQKRHRTFYFFTKDNNVTPIFDYIRRPSELIQDVLQTPYTLSKSDSMDILINQKNPLDDPWLLYCLEKNQCTSILDYYIILKQTINCIREAERISDSFLEISDWLRKNKFEKHAARAEAIQKKLDDNKGYYSHGGTTIPKNIIPAFIAPALYSTVQPFENRYISLREALRIMKMPDNFNLLLDQKSGNINNPNVICQNVPVTTAKDMMHFVLKYLNHDVELIPNTSFIKQSNFNKSFDIQIQTKTNGSINEFFV